MVYVNDDLCLLKNNEISLNTVLDIMLLTIALEKLMSPHEASVSVLF